METGNFSSRQRRKNNNMIIPVNTIRVAPIVDTLMIVVSVEPQTRVFSCECAWEVDWNTDRSDTSTTGTLVVLSGIPHIECGLYTSWPFETRPVFM